MKRKSKKILSDSLFLDETSASATTNDNPTVVIPKRTYRESGSIIDLPEGWEWIKLGNISYTASGGTPARKNKNYYNGTIPWVKSGELNYNIIRDTEEKVTMDAINNSSAKIFPKGTLLIALYGATIGKLAILGIDAATNQAVCGIFENDKIITKFLYLYLLYHKPEFIKIGFGGAQPNISQTIIKDLNIPLPPLPVQNKIVSKIEELFSELDNGVKELKKVKAQLKIYRQSVLHAAFTGKLTEEWRSLEENKELYEISEEKFIDKKKQELLRPLTSKYNSRNIEVEYRVLRDFILEAICKNVNDELINKVISDFPFDTYKSKTDNFLKSFLLWQTKSDEYLLLKGYSSFVLSQQRKAWIKYADDGLEGRVYQNPYMGYTQIAAFQDWMQIEKLKKEGVDYFKRTYILEPARKDYENEINLQKSVPKNLPKGWRISNLGSIARKITYKVLPSENSDLNFIGMDCIESHSLRLSILYDFKDFKSSGNYFIKGQILYGRMRPYLNKVYKAEFNGACSGEFIVLECEQELKSDLLKYILHSKEFVSFANNKTSGDRPRISFKEISEYIINLPPVEEQQKIVEEIETRLSVCDKMEETIETALAKSESLRQSILKQAFDGKLVN